MSWSRLQTVIFAAVHLSATLALLVVLATYAMPYYFYFPYYNPNSGGASTAAPPALVRTLNAYLAPAPSHVLSSAEEAHARNTDVLVHSALVHFAMAAVTYVTVTFVITPPFGRHAAGTLVRVRVPAALSWAVQECPTLLNVLYYALAEYPVYYYYSYPYAGSSTQLKGYIGVVTEGVSHLRLPLLLFVMHYAHRSLIYPLIVSPKANAVPIHVTWSATLYCLFNGRLQVLASLAPLQPDGGAASSFPAARCVTLALSSWQEPSMTLTAVGVVLPAALLFVVGSYLFFTGMRANMAADYHLATLREQRGREEGSGHSGDYVIPRGGLFERVSCPNFFGEMVEWVGYAVVVCACTAGSAGVGGSRTATASMVACQRAAWMSAEGAPTLAAMSFVVYVVANLLPRGLAHHAWYEHHFKAEYTSLNRKAVLPGIL